jgi:hypothetical protein
MVTSGNIVKFQNTIIRRGVFFIESFQTQKLFIFVKERILNPVSHLTNISYLESRGTNCENPASRKKFYSRISHHIFLISRFPIKK